MNLFIFNSELGWVLIFVAVLLLFGGRKIPQLAKDLGSGIREFRQGLMNSSQTTTQVEHQPQTQLEAPAEEYAPKKRTAKKAAKKSKARA